MGLHLSLAGLDALQRGMAEAPEMARRELLAAMTEATLLTEHEVKELMPGATNLTKNSVHADAFATPAGVLGIVGSASPVALFVEEGTRPHMPPVDALQPWVTQVLGVAPDRAREVAWLVARKIAKRGTKAQRPFARAKEAVEGEVLRIFEEAAARVAAQLAGGSA